MKIEWIELIADAVIYLIFLSGLSLVIHKYINIGLQRFALRHRLKMTRKPAREISLVFRYIRNMLFVVFKKPPDEKNFIYAIGCLFFFLFVLSLRDFSMPCAFGIAAMGSSMPILLITIKVEIIRKKGSKEGISVISELYRQYWIHNKNIFSAMEETVKGSAKCPICKNLLYMLLLRLRNTGNPLEIRESIDQFAFSLGTVWGRMLGVCIKLAAEKGIDVSDGISDIAEQLKLAGTRAEERRRINSESARITVFLVPILYLGTIFVAFYYLDVSIWALMKNQFGTPEGFLFFLMITFLFLINFSILELIQNQKIDY